jgi:hypothetical protein
MTARLEQLPRLLVGAVITIVAFALLSASAVVLVLVYLRLPEQPPEPGPPPALRLSLPHNHDGTYVPGTWVMVQLLSNKNGYVDVYSIDPEGNRERVFEVELSADEDIWREWRVPDAEGQWQLEARLNHDQDVKRLPFTVKWDLLGPAIGDVEFVPPIEARRPVTVTGGPVCPGGTAEAYVRVLDGSDLVRVELRTRYPPGAGDWLPERMQAASGSIYYHSLPAHEQPGTEYYVYAEDVNGNWSETSPQVYVAEPCFEILYDFVTEARDASWTIFYPNPLTIDFAEADSFAEGYALGGAHLRTILALEGAELVPEVLEALPPQVAGGEIWGRYELGDLPIKPGDQFLARVGLEPGADWGDTIFGIRFQSGDPAAPLTVAVTFPERIDADDLQGIRTWTVPLPGNLVGEYFDLIVDAGSKPIRDRAVWVEARLQRPLR